MSQKKIPKQSLCQTFKNITDWFINRFIDSDSLIHSQCRLHLFTYNSRLSGVPEAGRAHVGTLWRARVLKEERMFGAQDWKPSREPENPQGQTRDQPQERRRETQTWGHHTDPAPETCGQPEIRCVFQL